MISQEYFIKRFLLIEENQAMRNLKLMSTIQERKLK